MKKIFETSIFLCFLALFFFSCRNNDNTGASTTKGTVISSTSQPLNIMVFIDLSNRIIHKGTPSQIEKDTAIISYIANYFHDFTINSEEGIQESKNIMRIIFEPTPEDPNIVTCANNLVVDIPKIPEGTERLDRVQNIKVEFKKNLEQVYSLAANAKKFPGCDIWGFFSYKKIDKYIKEGYRNVMFILTDGYILHARNKDINGDTSTYILPNILDNPKSGLKVERNGLNNLEIAVLEINPENPKHLPKMQAMITNWFEGMGASKDNITVEQTNLPSTTRTVIDNILK